MEGTIAVVTCFAGNFAPNGWAFCSGQILSIAQNTALFSLLGTTFGGNGQTTFALPDLRGRVPLHPGQGPGLSDYVLGQAAGSETTTLLVNNLPAHTHQLRATSDAGSASAPADVYLANTGALDKEYAPAGALVAMNAGTIGPAGGSMPFDNLQPYLAINFIIAMQGIFPSRN